MFCTFSLQNVLFATAACNFWCLLSAPSSAPAALTSLLLDWPDTRIIEKTQHFATSLTFRAYVSSFFQLSDYCIFCPLTWLLYCWAMHVLFNSPYCRKFLFKLPSIILAISHYTLENQDGTQQWFFGWKMDFPQQKRGQVSGFQPVKFLPGRVYLVNEHKQWEKWTVSKMDFPTQKWENVPILPCFYFWWWYLYHSPAIFFPKLRLMFYRFPKKTPSRPFGKVVLRLQRWQRRVVW